MDAAVALEVRWTAAARADLRAAADYIAKDSERYAASFVDEARTASASLNVFPWRGRVVPEFGDKSLREIFVMSYRMVYRIMEKQVFIVALVHGARDLYLFIGKR
jgi:toxin ParE1/3/4